MQPVVLSLDCPKLRAVLSDVVISQHWEVLRRADSPLTVHELAKSCGTSDGVAQHMLDSLVEAGLAVRMKATSQRRRIVYRASSDRVIVQWDNRSDAHFAFLLEHRRNLRAHSRSVIDRHDDLEMRWAPNRRKFRGHASLSLTREESLQIYRLLRDAWEQITAIENTARKRDAAKKPKAEPAPGADPRSCADAEAHPYHIALEFRPLKWPELPIADIGMSEKQMLDDEMRYLQRAPAMVLTDRERQIANRLVDGETRPQVAKALGVSPNTIASATKRIYAKLGVRSRAEFVARMKSH
jgi:DNA-binding CsgD family transcriptional regulator/DNA-binding MarR family transcriptional regulator